MLSEQQFDVRYQKIREQTREKMRQVGAWRDQQIAKLFCDSEWTQEQIAEHLGKMQSWVSRRLLFGRFCNFLYALGIKKLPVNLNERRFRGLWESVATKRVPTGSPAERAKFQAIIETDEWQFQIADAPPFATNDALSEHCTNRKWMDSSELSDTIGEHLDVPDDIERRVKHAIGRIKGSNAGGLAIQEKTFAGGVVKYKLSKVKNAEATSTRAITVAQELATIMEEIHLGLQQKHPHDQMDLIKPQIKRLNSLVKKYS